ncbi:MAG: peptidylprolyl isomerase [Alphaproteobacteria bacterium]|nr:peptidylprolyl isomerase [Alphaproteobacteria bacterium]
MRRHLFALLATTLCLGAAPLSPADIVAGAPAADWRTLDPANLLVMRLPAGTVIIELAPDFAPHTVANLKRLAHAHYFDGGWIVRAQDNYVVQWSQDGPKAKAEASHPGYAEFEQPRRASFRPLPDADAYARQAGFDGDFPAASGGAREWLVHCYGMVGAGRDVAPASGSGVELYAVNGQAPRHLDRNITLLGRVVSGMELLSSLPRGSGALGFYEKPAQRTRILSVALASETPHAPRLQLLRPDSASFQAYVEARRNRRDAWFARPAGHIDVCNIPLPVRTAK